MVKTPPTSSSEPYLVREAATAKPKLRTDLVFTPQEFGGRPGYLIEDPLRTKFFRLGAPEYTLVSVFDGRTTISEAVQLTAAPLGPRAFTEPEALAIGRWLVESQLAATPESAGADRLAAAARKGEFGRHAAALNPLAIRFRLINPDRLLDALLPWCGGLLSWPALIVWSVVLLLALATATLNLHQLADRSAVLLDPGNWLRLAVAWSALKLIHESFHALACKKFGGNVVRAGVMLLFFAPVAYTDVTSSWRFRSKWHRIVTAAAGIYAELFVAALAILFWARTPDGFVHRMVCDIALMASIGTVVFNINPLLRFDGYYILSDLVGVPNLYSAGRQAVVDLLKRVGLGQQTARTDGSTAMRRLILVYGMAALAWLGTLYVGLALLVISVLSYLGAALVGVFMIFGIAVPVLRLMRETIHTGSFDRNCRRRLARNAIVAAVAGLFGAWLLARPGRVEAPAVVEYAPLSTLRAATAGFVREVCIRSGESVRKDQIIAVLENPELVAELAELQLSSAQSAIRARAYFADQELAKYQIETAAHAALEKRVGELSGQVASLTIRSPTRGHVLARQLHSLIGQYLKPGAEIAMVGDEDAKELVVAVAQDDLESFHAQLGSAVTVRILGIGGEQLTWDLTSIDPLAGLSVPHAALSSRARGPLPVKMKLSNTNQDNADSAEHDELLRPCFKASVRIPAGDSVRLRAGQKATIGFASPVESSGGRMARQIGEWIRNQLARVKSATSGPNS